mgnify:CR=1 FL=1
MIEKIQLAAAFALVLMLPLAAASLRDQAPVIDRTDPLWAEAYEESCLTWDGIESYMRADALGACRALRNWRDQ